LILEGEEKRRGVSPISGWHEGAYGGAAVMKK
jgi:hypothetical protein